MKDHCVFRITDDFHYRQWINDFDTMENADFEFIEQKISSLLVNPHIAILPLTVGEPSQKDLAVFIQALEKQLYKNWCVYLPQDLNHIDQSTTATTEKLSSALIEKAVGTADFILPLPLDAVLPSHALAALVFALAAVPDADMIYADEDFLEDGKRSRPRFKTDWDPYFNLGCNSVGVPALYRSEALRRVNIDDLTSATVDNLLHAVTLRVSGTIPNDRILHIPSVLCHRTQASDWSREEACRIVSAHLARQGAPVAEISPAPLAPQGNRVRFTLADSLPLVSLIIPTRDRADLIGRCCNGILSHTDYPSLELIIVDNGTVEPDALAILDSLKADPRIKLLRDDRPFNYSQLNNFAAKTAKGDILVLLNNDIEVLHTDWLRELVSLASRPDIGIAGAKLLYPDLRVQHAGMVFGPDRLVVHQMRRANRYDSGPQGELGLLRSVSAVTGACLALRKSLYFDAGGLDEKNLKVACNDIDLCRRVAKMGLAIVWTPFAELMHHECATRGAPMTAEKADREMTEVMAFWSMNPELYESPDSFHNPQIEYKHDCVDFARPPRFHPLRFELKEPQVAPFLY
jgi:O-antigen biosynthesis protein